MSVDTENEPPSSKPGATAVLVLAEAKNYLEKLDGRRRFGLLPEIHGRYIDEATGVAGKRCLREQPSE